MKKPRHISLYLLYLLCNLIGCNLLSVDYLAYTTNEEISVVREMPSYAEAGETIAVDITVTIGTGITDPINGFYCTDEIPEELLIQPGTYTTTLNGFDLSNTTEEVGMSGDVYPATVPYRLILETPPDFIEGNALQPGDELILSFSITIPVDASENTVYVFPGFSWVGYITGDPHEYIFGYESVPEATLTIISSSQEETICNDALDNDLDGLTDCADYDCDGEVGNETTCGVGECAGNTGNLICQDGGQFDTCNPLAGATSEDCSDGLDNDCDGLTDCADSACAGPPCDEITVYEDAEDGLTDRWYVYDSNPAGAAIYNVFDADRQSNVIEFSGSGTQNGYRLTNGDGNLWHNSSQSEIEWSMKYSEPFAIFIDLNTTAGHRFLEYRPLDTDNLGTGEYVQYGLGTDAMDGQWHTYVRDLQADLNVAQPGVTILEVNGFMIRGSGMLDDIILFGPILNDSTVYENAEDGMTDRWYVYDSNPAGAAIYNVYDADRQSNVIEFSGAGTDNGYRLTNPDGSLWHNSSQSEIEWSMKYSESFTVYIDLETTAGHRFLEYRPLDTSDLGTGEYVRYGLGTDATDGQWHTFVRDLQADLEGAQPGVTILEVNGFLIRGSGMVDDIILFGPILNDSTVYENAEDGMTDRWYVYDSNPAGAAIYNVYDVDRQSNVIEFSGAGTDNGYRLTTLDGTFWHSSGQSVIEWSMKYSEPFTIYIDLETTAGHRYLIYVPTDYNGLGAGEHVNYGLGTDARDGEWHTYVRDLQADLEGAQPGVIIVEVNGFLIRGSGMVDDISLLGTIPNDSTVYENAEDGTTDRWYVYDNNPSGAAIYNVYDADRQSNVIEFSGAGTDNGYRLTTLDGTFWHNSGQSVIEWSMKYSEPFTIYIDLETTAGHRYLIYVPTDYNGLGAGEHVNYGLGTDARDGEWHTYVRDLQADLEGAQPGVIIVEVNGFLIRGSGMVDDISLLGTIPNDGTVYENAEDGTTDRWYVYDNNPSGAAIYNVYDADRQSNVIEFSGAGTDNGYRLTTLDGTFWHNSGQSVIEWSMKYSEPFTIYIDLETTAGHRYLIYVPTDYNGLGAGEHVNYGLGTDARDGEWHTYVRDLQADLEGAQPGVIILEVNGFLIRGSGMVDDIKLYTYLPH